jgi:DmsE family decaheme c-type cytochrome
MPLNNLGLRGALVVAGAVVWATAVTLTAAPKPVRATSTAVAPPHQTQAQAAQARPIPTDPAARPEDYADDDTCTTCHEAEGKSIHASLHGKAVNPRTPAGLSANHTCETCHGPGKAHAESGDKSKIRVFTAMPPRDASAVCVTCHDRGTHAMWQGSMHDARNLSCVSCHSAHNFKSPKAQLRAAGVTELCATCHRTEAAKLQRSGHMPLREGKMDCASCHNPHGSTNTRMLKIGNWVNETCVSCHTEKRGPFLWEHAPVREACNTCHDPHGSNNERMLVAKLPMLCQRCHIGTRHPSTIYDGLQLQARSNRLIGRGCVNCHAQIHGSNSPAGNTFIR